MFITSPLKLYVRRWDSIHLNLNYSRSWFQTPNSYDSLNVTNVVSGGAGPNPVFANVGYRPEVQD